jgi:hypothetical protein
MAGTWAHLWAAGPDHVFQGPAPGSQHVACRRHELCPAHPLAARHSTLLLNQAHLPARGQARLAYKQPNFYPTFKAVFRIRIRKTRYAFGPPGSGFIIICTDPDPSINKEKNWFYAFVTSEYWNLLSLKTDVNVPVPTVSNKQKNYGKNWFFVYICKATEKRAGSGSENQRYGSVDPDPYYQYVPDPEHCLKVQF